MRVTLFGARLLQSLPGRSTTASLLAQLTRPAKLACWSGMSIACVLVLNNCDDNSAASAVHAAARHPKLLLDVIEADFPASQAHVGSARRLALERALELTDDRARSVLLTTDADAVPRADWIENNLRAIDEGAAIVGGHILGDKTEEALLGSYFLRRARRQLHFGRTD